MGGLEPMVVALTVGDPALGLAAADGSRRGASQGCKQATHVRLVSSRERAPIGWLISCLWAGQPLCAGAAGPLWTRGR